MNRDGEIRRVVTEADNQNGWEVVAVIQNEYTEGDGVLPSGIIAFSRNLFPIWRQAYGTAEYGVNEETGILFFYRGHYDFTHDEAIEDFAKRSNISCLLDSC